MCAACEWEIWLLEVNSLLRSSRYDFARDELLKLRVMIRREKHVSAAQVESIRQIIRTQEDDAIS